MRARDNPFRSERVLQVRYRLEGLTWPELLERLAGLQYRAALVGPQGTGKTTLLEDLGPRLLALGFRPRPLRLDQTQRTFPGGLIRELSRELDERDVVLLDGAEQLSWFGWRYFRRRTRPAGGLIITSHRPGLLPTLLQCRTSPELLGTIVSELAPSHFPHPDGQAGQLFVRHAGNLRTALRELYDCYAALPD